MKRTLFATMLILPMFSVIKTPAQTLPGPEIITKEIIYDVGINNFEKYVQNDYGDCDFYLDRENVLPDYRLAFLTSLFDLALTNKLNITDTNDVIINDRKLKALLAGMDHFTLKREYPPYNTFDTVIPYQAEQIKKLRFREEWNHQPATMELSKKILAFAPVREIYDRKNSLISSRPLFWVIQNKQEPTGKEKLLSSRIFSTTSCYKFKGSNCKENTDYERTRNYIKLLFSRSCNNEMKIYSSISDINSGNLVPLTVEELHKILDRADTFRLTRPYPPYNEYDTAIRIEIIPDSIKLIRFIEEWYVDPETMYFVKKIIGAGPVDEVFDPVTGEFKGYRPIYYTYFNDIWLPFDKKIVIKN
jgi:hypothetical protein